MLASRYRFHGHGSLRYVYGRGQVSRSKSFICKASVNPRRQEPRVAVVVSKKVVKSAVKRNRIRRRLYEAIRRELPQLQPQLDLVLIVISADVLTNEPDAIRDALTQVLAQANLYKPH